jgi:hypothetical protein
MSVSDYFLLEVSLSIPSYEAPPELLTYYVGLGKTVTARRSVGLQSIHIT